MLKLNSNGNKTKTSAYNCQPPFNFKPGSTPVHSQNINKCAISSQPFEGPGNHARPQADGILCVALA